MMRVLRFIAAAAALSIALLPARADQILGPGRIDSSGRVVLPGGPKLGSYQNGKFIPNLSDLQVCTAGSTTAPVPSGQPFACGGFVLIAQ